MKNYLQVFGMLIAAFIFGIAANPAVGQPGPGGPNGMGPGMMGGYGGPGAGNGPVPRGGYGGPGFGMGPGMMGGYGMGAGMMGGHGGSYGMGAGMMGGYGGGYGMMGPGNFGGLNLSADQKAKVTQIQRDARRKMWSLMGRMMESQYALQDLYDADKQDAAAINRQFKELEDMRRQMVESSVDMHNRINEILTKEQREQTRGWGRGYGPMMGRQ